MLLLIFGFVWYLSAQTKIDVLDGLGATIFVYVWVGVLGSYACSSSRPTLSPTSTASAYMLGAVILTVANDTGALFIGRWLGRHPLNRVLSPNKTIEGSIGGTLLTLTVAALLLPPHQPLDHEARPRARRRALCRGAAR